MKVLKFLVVVLALAVVFSCGPQGSAPETPVAVDMDPAQIKDAAAWVAAYDKLLTEYGKVATQLNGGNTALMGRAGELQKLGSALDVAALNIKSTLSGQALADFEVHIVKFKEAMIAAAGN